MKGNRRKRRGLPGGAWVLGGVGLLILALSVVLLVLTQLPLDQRLSDRESTETFANPNRGWYTMVGYPENGPGSQDSTQVLERVCREVRQEGESLVGFHIRLHDLMTAGEGALPPEALNGLAAQLQLLREQGVQAVVRPVYDEMGQGQPEPSLDTILTHIDQLGPVFSQYSDVILTVELGYLGVFGEWHDGKYDTQEARSQVLSRSLTTAAWDVRFSLRTPRFYRELFGVEEPVSRAEVRNGSDLGRVGFFNDGFLGSESDLGTYTDRSREQELAFQEVHSQCLPFGGEAVLLTEYGRLFSAVSDMERTHCTYLNKTHYLPLKERWKEEIYEGEQAKNQEYEGQSGYKYIQDHLGYRLVLRSAALPGFTAAGLPFAARLEIENTGFGNILKPCTAELIWEKEGKTVSQKLAMDPRDWNGGERSAVFLSLRAPKTLERGTWTVMLRLTDGDFSRKELAGQPDFRRIRFANEEGYDLQQNAQRLGTVRVL